MYNNEVETYAQLQGKFRKFSYIVGVTYSGQFFKEAERESFFQSFLPNVSISYTFNENWYLSYQYANTPILPTLSELSDVEQRQNEYEIVSGNLGHLV